MTYIMLIAILLPIAAGTVMLVTDKYDAMRLEIFSEAVVIINTILVLFIVFDPPTGTLHLFSIAERLPVTLRADGMARFYGGLVAFLWPLATLYSFEYMEHDDRKRQFTAFYTMTYGITIGVAFSGNIVTMYLFYEMLTIVTLPLVMHKMDDASKRAAREYLYYMIGGTAFAFIGIGYYVMNSFDIEFVFGGNLDAAALSQNGTVTRIVLLMAFFGFGVKAAIFPFHKWLIDASVAPTPVTALLHAVAVVKSGVFAVGRLIYFCYGYDGFSRSWVHYVMLIASMVTIVYGSSMAVRENHLKRRLAYSTVGNLSYILLAFSVLSPMGLIAGMMHILCHAFMKIGAFLCCGSIMHRANKHYVSDMNGMGYAMPRVFTLFTIQGLALTGLPLLAGFVSKMQIAMSLLSDGLAFSNPGVMTLLYSSLMSAIYILTIVVRAFYPVDRDGMDERLPYSDPGCRMLIPLVIFAVMTLFIGLYAQPFIDAAVAVTMN